MGNGLVLTGIGAGAIADTTFAPGALAPAAISINGAAKIGVGTVVQRPTAALPATTTTAIFTVAGGRVKLIDLVGEVTTVLQAQACNVKVQANSTAAGSSVDLCANLDVSGLVVGALLGITGTLADAMASGLAIKGQVAPVIVQAGTIDLVASATNTGSVKWTIRYQPIDDGATVIAA